VDRGKDIYAAPEPGGDAVEDAEEGMLWGDGALDEVAGVYRLTARRRYGKCHAGYIIND
jgi:hypothetical protein